MSREEISLRSEATKIVPINTPCCLHNRTKQVQLAPGEFLAGFPLNRGGKGRRNIALISGKYTAAPGIDAGGNDAAVGVKRGERLLGGLGIVEINGRRAVVANDFGQDRDTPDQFVAEGRDVIGDERGAGQQQHNTAGQHDDQRLFAPDGHVLEKRH